ncbi:hypothetical protein [Qipengyuania flava]|uniref:hypothetical protein n=1 Tax=Qipengyuania flava TaxID=192812 RepID=UPI001C62B2BD|nr:hypothetical protein [Qipengyuania flava]QYJ06631.1 hypothetical protein KUV82_11240 [Qipengyuania flava]
MKHTARLARFSFIASTALVLAACGGDASEAERAADEAEETRGSYDIDTATGETSARYTDEDGTTTTMRSGESVPVELPTGFTVYPGATVVNNTRVEQADGLLVLLNLESEDTPEEMVAFYRKQAEEAGIDIAMSIQSGPTTMIGGEQAGGASFSFTATREEDTTSAQLSVGSGLE